MTSRMAVNYPGMFRALASALRVLCHLQCGLRRPRAAGRSSPTLFLHGLLDPIVPLPTMEAYRNALQRDGHEVETVLSKTASHQWLPEGSRLSATGSIAILTCCAAPSVTSARRHIGPPSLAIRP